MFDTAANWAGFVANVGVYSCVDFCATLFGVSVVFVVIVSTDDVFGFGDFRFARAFFIKANS